MTPCPTLIRLLAAWEAQGQRCDGLAWENVKRHLAECEICRRNAEKVKK